MKSRWNVTEMSQWYVSTTSYWHIFPKVTTMSHQWVFHNISKKSQMKHPTMSQWFAIKTFQWYVSTTSHQYVPVTSPVNPKRSTKDVAAVCLHHISKLPCCDALLVGLYYVFKLNRSTLQSPLSGRFPCLYQVSNRTTSFSITSQDGSEKSSLDYTEPELLLHLKIARCINNIYNNYCVDIWIYQ